MLHAKAADSSRMAWLLKRPSQKRPQHVDGEDARQFLQAALNPALPVIEIPARERILAAQKGASHAT